MIIIETKLKVIPKKCTKCKYSYCYDDNRFCSLAFKNGYNRPIPYEFSKEKNNWMYTKPEWCPMKEIEPVGWKYRLEDNG